MPPIKRDCILQNFQITCQRSKYKQNTSFSCFIYGKVLYTFDKLRVNFTLFHDKGDNFNWEWMSEIGCLTSHATIFQLYMWRHIDVQADWRRNWTYGRASRHFVGFSLQAPIRATLFNVISRNRPIYSSLTTRCRYGGPILILTPRGPHGETISFSILQTFLSWIPIFLLRPAIAFLFPM